MDAWRLGRRMAALSGQGKLALSLLADGVFLPVCALLAVALGPLNLAGAIDKGPLIYLFTGAATIVVLAFTGLYRSVVRFIDFNSVAVTSTGLASVVAALYLAAKLFRFDALPASAIINYWFVAFAYLLTSRLLARTMLQSGLKRPGRPRRRTLIYGAGSAGVELARAMHLSLDYQAMCFVDDAQALWGRVVAGLKVCGPQDMAEAIRRHDIEQIVVAMPSAAASERRALIARIEAFGLPVKMLPGLTQLVSGHASVSDIRDIDVSDLLGRDPVPPNPELFARNIRGKVVVVTGAAGSIGSELCRQVLTQQPARLVLLDHSEFGLYTIEQELHQLQPGAKLSAVLGTVIDEDLLVRTFRAHGVQTVYHAAAYKHVPIVESNVRQGVRNNVFGSLAVARAAAKCRLESCVLVSTDKAVRPTNVMGASKRVAELIFQAAAAASKDAPTVFSMVRFGNVLGSSGSVVPLFKRQIEDGGPITITHPDIIRYFMLIAEAAQLVIQAGAMARGGEVFVLDMGEPVKIADLARTMLRLYGLTEKTPGSPDGDIELKFVGLRAGEKLYEELLIGDKTIPSDHPRIMCALERHVEPALLDKMLAGLRKACDSDDDEAVLRQIRNLVPEYRPADEVNQEAARFQHPSATVDGQALASQRPAFLATGP